MEAFHQTYTIAIKEALTILTLLPSRKLSPNLHYRDQGSFNHTYIIAIKEAFIKLTLSRSWKLSPNLHYLWAVIRFIFSVRQRLERELTDKNEAEAVVFRHGIITFVALTRLAWIYRLRKLTLVRQSKRQTY